MPGRKVKGLASAEFVEISHQVVVVIDKRLVVFFSILQVSIVNPGVVIDNLIV